MLGKMRRIALHPLWSADLDEGVSVAVDLCLSGVAPESRSPLVDDVLQLLYVRDLVNGRPRGYGMIY